MKSQTGSEQVGEKCPECKRHFTLKQINGNEIRLNCLCYTCNGCKQKVYYSYAPIAGGPDKGKKQLFKHFCKCTDKILAEMAIGEKIEMTRKKFLEEHSIINDELKHATFDNYNPYHTGQRQERIFTAKALCMEFAEGFDLEKPANLFLFGDSGVGKSHLGVSIVKELLYKKVPGREFVGAVFIDFPELLKKIRNTYRKNSAVSESDILKVYKVVDFLVIDDLGAEPRKINDDGRIWSLDVLFEILNARQGKHTMITSNLDGQKMVEHMLDPSTGSSRVWSRFANGLKGQGVYGVDYRQKDLMTSKGW